MSYTPLLRNRLVQTEKIYLPTPIRNLKSIFQTAPSMENTIAFFEPTEQYRVLLSEASRDVGQVTEEQWDQLGEDKNVDGPDISHECKRTQTQENMCYRFIRDNVYCENPLNIKVLTLTMKQLPRVPPRGNYRYMMKGPIRLTRGILSLARGQMAVLPLNSVADQKTRVTCYCSRSSPIGGRTIEDWKDAKPVLVPKGGCVKLEEGEAMFLVIQILPKGGEEGAEAPVPQISPS
ncbi:hypothetical protein B0T16DRAFT_145709 [Cercophora newfieldiana]|uniref:Uncharacterized protein n=1 Tax=Cercophora newfieldiana TaxID=92897 RepID=A0AA40CP92_9PEZI|nr:hypothetical protein B0T16DRAFT_145709 [Cercophora newfieldiana]